MGLRVLYGVSQFISIKWRMHMNKCIIFGLSCFSDLVANYIEAENQYEIIAYTVNEKYLKSNFYNGKPVLPLKSYQKFLI